MPKITLPDVDEETVSRLTEEARRQGLSMSTLILRIINKAVGTKRGRQRRVYTDLDHLAGTWSEEETSAFLKSVSDFEKVADRVDEEIEKLSWGMGKKLYTCKEDLHEE